MAGFARYFSDAPWEKKVGYCRALRAGNHIYVTGTVAINDDGTVFAPGDAYAQTKRCLELIVRALSPMGVELCDVVRTRMFVTDIARWEEYGRAHREAFGQTPPATTMVEISRLIGDGMTIEIEADAVLEE